MGGWKSEGVLADKVLAMPAIGFRIDLRAEVDLPEGFHQVEVWPHTEGLEIRLGHRTIVVRPQIQHRPEARFGALDCIFDPDASLLRYGASWPEAWLCLLDMVQGKGMPCFESLPWFVHPLDANVWLGMMRAQPRPSGDPTPDQEALPQALGRQDRDDQVRFSSLTGEALTRGFLAAKVENFRVALAAIALQEHAASVTMSSTVATLAVRNSKIPEEAQQFLCGLPDASLLVWFNRAAQTLAYTEPAAFLAMGYLYNLLGTFVGTALAAALADELVVSSELLLKIADDVSLPEQVQAWLREQPGTATVTEWVERVRAALEQVQ